VHFGGRVYACDSCFAPRMLLSQSHFWDYTKLKAGFPPTSQGLFL
jgi:hypothetical protein